jgi:hypothetical protein
MAKPKRIQLSRTKGWRMPANTVKVDRSTKFGNPWTVKAAREAGHTGTDAELQALTVGLFADALSKGLPAVADHLEHIEELRGKNLACWCKPGTPCHADVLLEIANRKGV